MIFYVASTLTHISLASTEQRMWWQRQGLQLPGRGAASPEAGGGGGGGGGGHPGGGGGEGAAATAAVALARRRQRHTSGGIIASAGRLARGAAVLGTPLRVLSRSARR